MSEIGDYKPCKKIVFVINNLKTGGVQTSLLNLLEEIDDIYDVTLISFSDFDKTKLELPQKVKLKVLKSPFKYLGLSQSDFKKRPFQYVMRAFFVVVTKLFGRSFAIKLISMFQRKIGTYDYAISYLHEAPQKIFYGGCNEFVLKKIKAKKKISWLHCDFKLSGANSEASRKIYCQFDNIIACSEGVRNSFIECMPQLDNKCIAIRNCNNFERIKQLAGEGKLYCNSKFNVVTVARLSEEKGIDRAILAIKKCVELGNKIHYHIVGSGELEPYLKKLTAENDLTDIVTFYGNQVNPYPYIKGADLFLLSSYHEAAPMVFDEAAFLGVPVLATKTTSSYEMITEVNAGVVCDNSQIGIENALIKIINDKEFLYSIRDNLKKMSFTNKKIVDAFCRTLD